MRLRDKPLKFDRITHHAKVTQCLGAIGVASEPWYLAVAPPSIISDEEASSELPRRLCPFWSHFNLPFCCYDTLEIFCPCHCTYQIFLLLSPQK